MQPIGSARDLLPEFAPPPRPSRWRVYLRAIRRFGFRPSLKNVLTLWIPLLLVTLGAVAFAYRDEITSYADARFGELRDAVEESEDFQLRRVEIVGRRNLPEPAVMEALGLGALDGPRSALSFDAAEARRALIASPWVDRATVSVDPSGLIRVRLEERDATALWRDGARYWLLDRDGERIAAVGGPDARPDLPYILGATAPAAAAEARSLLASAPRATAREITALVRRGGRRWDAVSARGFVIKLPAKGALAALRRYHERDLGRAIVGKAVVALDLRRPTEPPVLVLERGVAAVRSEVLDDLLTPLPQ